MSEIRSLMRIDALQILSYWKFSLGAALIAVVFLVTGNPTTGIVMASVFALITAMGPLANAEVSGVDRLFGTLPVSRRSVVKAHYAVALACLLTVMVVLLAAVGLAGVVQHQWMMEPLMGVVGTTLALTMIFALHAPIMIRFGSRVASLVLAVLIPVAGMVGSMLFESLSRADVQLPRSGSTMAWLLAAAAVLLPVAAIVVSYLISARIYERQDH